jgi:Ser/Thr protein kinase RdoA (MazF antagonist)
MTYNKRRRRAIAIVLFRFGKAVTKDEIIDALRAWDEKLVPSNPTSLGSILSRTSFIISKTGRDGVLKIASDGRKRRAPLYEINWDIVKEEDDIPYLLPKSALYRNESREAIQCVECNRFRLMSPHSETVCLHCLRKSERI